MIMQPDPQDHDDGWDCPPVDPDEFAHLLALWAECPSGLPALREAVRQHDIALSAGWPVGVTGWGEYFADWDEFNAAYDGPDWCDILEEKRDV